MVYTSAKRAAKVTELLTDACALWWSKVGVTFNNGRVLAVETSCTADSPDVFMKGAMAQ